MAPGYPAQFHPEYVRNGVANLFMMLQPLTGTCHVRVRQRRAMRRLVRIMGVVDSVRR